MKMGLNGYDHWQLAEDADGIVWATLDKAGESTNSLSTAVLQELARMLDRFDAQPPRGLIFRSGKAAGFIAGADIEEFTELDTAEKGIELVARGWHLFNRLARVSYPTLALVRGHCLGGGLELALACRYLLVVDEPATRLGLPEVMLGIVPGWGGMLRLPERIGPQAALDMMLTGKTVDAQKARRLGLADDLVPPRVMTQAAAMLVVADQARRRPALLQRVLAGPLRQLVARGARRQVARRARPEHYPAPYAIIDLWARHQGNALAAPELIDTIVRSPTARNLVRVFFLQERLKAFAKGSDFSAQRVHIVGAGVMGGDIAAWCALRGLTVTLQDQGIERIAPALQRAYAAWSRRIRDERELRRVLDRLIPDPDGNGARQADIVIEAIFENVGAKQALLQSLEAVIRPDAVLATNTSSLRLEDLRSVLARPERLIGIHFFNPVSRMPLVEVVNAEGSDAQAIRRAIAFVRQIDRLPLPVRSAPGFLVNAVLGPYMLAAMRAVDEGLAPETVDEAMLAFGMPMGPIELVDMVGLDVAMAAGRSLANPAEEPPRCLLERFAAGQLGKKAGRGFYEYRAGKPAKASPGAVPAGLAERLLQPLLERAQQLVAEGVVADADLADAGIIFGTGFAPFTGGPLNYLRSQYA
ncbi:MAG TPA: 3-hydroxyacyl-CoA dehydrogenase NAD-binding domain-containing protein [Accumulibacter sp.]|uniref:3-hydroxyacyl-CoA dehydrogenase NAD-binding domain-containing protein n=1 Tax=Accumulibacter sp. TaxID=2053492 RepID=UPI002CDD5081|nr:3-hydroxyacyl-CoA dehydrogenase NAD-binding domain-containing protein [Accumulibacter sp.]HMV05703.1 3-hydroxyacyl-CoA dehydrogenase NAD-binding domain-containing protein [Accumulibacter sp.]HNN84628.1 3-hydroxyacyl-CoA dehydrogenase NAD-binding domain-containing protein [Accumulibacter sp.]